MENRFFQLSDIPGSENSFFQEKRFLTNSLFRLVETVLFLVEPVLFYSEPCWSKDVI